MEACIIFPHQLFEEHPGLSPGRSVYLVENDLFFKQYPFHKNKLVLHRASMKAYGELLEKKGYSIYYMDSIRDQACTDRLAERMKKDRVQQVFVADVTDDWLRTRLTSSLSAQKVKLTWLNSPGFLLTAKDATQYPLSDKHNLQAGFYTHMRRKYNVLVDNRGRPAGGKWSFDSDNRKRYPAGQPAPRFIQFGNNAHVAEAKDYVDEHFSKNPGSCSDFFYPVTHREAEDWLKEFIATRFAAFGPYEDAIVHREILLNHSLISPLINTGLLTPEKLLHTILHEGADAGIPLASVEGFTRQVLGWREYIRVMYEQKGRKQRTSHFWGFSRKVPASWWNGSTGIAPIDLTIKKILQTGYCHHIERLMVLGNFMLLCEFDPDSVYEWFMALFIDSYDWVMVPNVYGMSQFADGGLMCTKPYISGSNYLVKMGDFPTGEWQKIWDALFWRFMHVHRSFFSQNPRLGMLLKTLDRMPEDKRTHLLQTAETYLQTI